MYEEEIHLKKLLLKQLDMVLEHLTLVTLTFDPVTPKLIWFICYPGLMCGPSLRKVSQGVLDRKRKGYRRTETYRPTDMCKALSSSKGGIQIKTHYFVRSAYKYDISK